MAESSRKLLIVEDDPALQRQMRWAFDDFEVVTAADREGALAMVRRHEPAVVTMDLGLPPQPDAVDEGFRLLAELLAAAPDTRVIVLTGQHDRENAVRAIGCGAHDFFAKPFEPDLLKLTIERAFAFHDLMAENRRLQAASASRLQGVLTRAPTMLKVCRLVEKVAPADVTVTLLGESGTGKEVMARNLHALSPRSAGRFVAINCAAIPDALLEAELFGYEKGAFTGAVRQTAGKIEMAQGGTLFLDEIGDLPLPLQAKLLRFLQERVIERVGGRSEIEIDVRVVCATHRNLVSRVAEGEFREDLYYRLAEIVIEIPPLREREGDACLLAHAFLQRFAVAMGMPAARLGADAAEALARHSWPGNVRELENCIKRALIMADDGRIDAGTLALGPAPADQPPEPLNLRQIRDEAERQAVVRVLARTNDNVARAAETLGISRPSLYDLMNRFGIKREACHEK